MGHDFLSHDIKGLDTDILTDEAFNDGPFVKHAGSDETGEFSESQDDGFLPLLVNGDGRWYEDEEEKREEPEGHWKDKGKNHAPWPWK
jgi:hypothetical protein